MPLTIDDGKSASDARRLTIRNPDGFFMGLVGIVWSAGWTIGARYGLKQALDEGRWIVACVVLTMWLTGIGLFGGNCVWIVLGRESLSLGRDRLVRSLRIWPFRSFRTEVFAKRDISAIKLEEHVSISRSHPFIKRWVSFDYNSRRIAVARGLSAAEVECVLRELRGWLGAAP